MPAIPWWLEYVEPFSTAGAMLVAVISMVTLGRLAKRQSEYARQQAEWGKRQVDLELDRRAALAGCLAFELMPAVAHVLGRASVICSECKISSEVGSLPADERLRWWVRVSFVLPGSLLAYRANLSDLGVNTGSHVVSMIERAEALAEISSQLSNPGVAQHGIHFPSAIANYERVAAELQEAASAAIEAIGGTMKDLPGWTRRGLPPRLQ